MSTPATQDNIERQKNAFIEKLVEIVRKKGDKKPEIPKTGKNP